MALVGYRVSRRVAVCDRVLYPHLVYRGKRAEKIAAVTSNHLV